MGNFQACQTLQEVSTEARRPPPFPALGEFDAFNMDDEGRDSSVTRGVVDAAISKGTGAGGRPIVRLLHRSGASVEVYLLGATVTSYKLANGLELLYLPQTLESDLETGKLIRGGIPVIFPQFGGTAGLPGLDLDDTSAMPSLGFARAMTWEVNSIRHHKT